VGQPLVALDGHHSEIDVLRDFVGIDGVFNMSPKDHMGLDLTYFRMIEVKKGDWVPVQ